MRLGNAVPERVFLVYVFVIAMGHFAVNRTPIRSTETASLEHLTRGQIRLEFWIIAKMQMPIFTFEFYRFVFMTTTTHIARTNHLYIDFQKKTPFFRHSLFFLKKGSLNDKTLRKIKIRLVSQILSHLI